MEGFVAKWLIECIIEKLDLNQHGVIAGSSTVTALVELLHLWYVSSDDTDLYTHIGLLDYKKAFDYVNHRKVLGKLQQLNVPDI